jgi:hypothetical protein
MKKFSVLSFLILTVFVSEGQNTQGFFIDGQGKTAVIPSFQDAEKSSKTPTTTIGVDFANVIAPISKYLYGNNSNIYMSQMVDQPVLINNIKALSPNVLRFPGGNLSSVYFWNASAGQAPPDAPAKLADANGVESNAGYWYGQTAENWSMSLDNYYQMLQLTNSTGIITTNYGYARYSTAANPVASAAHLAADWVRYDNGRTKFWEIGNESNGTWQAGHRINTANNKDGQPQIITGALYGKHFKVFADSMRKAAAEKGAIIYIGAQLLQEEPASWWNNTDRTWNDGVFQEAGNKPDFYIIHSYYTPYQANSIAKDILATATTVTKTMMDYVTSSMTKAGVTIKPVALTEWNIFAEGSKQQASFINGMHAAIVLGELMKNKYGFASRWDLANGWGDGNDHGMFNQGDEPGVPKWNPRAVFYYMYYFQKYMGDHLVNSTVSGSADVLAYASKFSSGQAGMVVVNKGTAEQTIAINISNFGFGDRYYWHSLTGGTDNGEFSLKVNVNGQASLNSSGGPANVESVKAFAASTAGGLKITAPAKSVHYILVENGNNVITGTEQPGDKSTLQVYPNPVNNTLRVDLPSSGFLKIEIIDSKGASQYEGVLNPAVTSHEMRISLPAGIYQVRLHKRGEVVQKKIIIN